MEFMRQFTACFTFWGWPCFLVEITSWVLVKKERPSLASVRLAWKSMHLVATPGLIILIFTGILQSAALYWEHFQGSYYMHLKVILSLIILVLLFWDMRTQKNILRQQPELDVLIHVEQASGYCFMHMLSYVNNYVAR